MFYAVTDIKGRDTIALIAKFSRKKFCDDFVRNAGEVDERWFSIKTKQLRTYLHGSTILKNIKIVWSNYVYTVDKETAILSHRVDIADYINQSKNVKDEINPVITVLNDSIKKKEKPNFTLGGHAVVTLDWQKSIYFFPKRDRFCLESVNNLIVHLNGNKRDFIQYRLDNELEFEQQILTKYNPQGDWEYQQIFSCWYIDHKTPTDISFFTSEPPRRVKELFRLPISVRTEMINDLTRQLNSQNAELLRYEAKIDLIKFQKKVYENTISEIKQSISDDTTKTQTGIDKSTKGAQSISSM